jgi:hypothetical protein
MLEQLNKPFHIGTARFTEETYNQNLKWKKRKKWHGACYGFDKKLPTTIKTGDLVFIIEMNNTKNMIMGIGLIQNYHRPENRTRIYNSEEWNQFVYRSEYHISRKDILQKSKGNYMIMFLERLLFTGYGHFKRGQGCLTIPYNRIAIWGSSKTKKIEKSRYYCRICGLPSKNHKCPGVRVRAKPKSKKCHICGKTKKGHICTGRKKNFKLLNNVLTLFKELFL